MKKGISFFSKSTQSGSYVTPFEDTDVSLSLRVSSIDSGGAEKVDVNDAINSYTFESDYKLWRHETDMLSVNNFDNKYFNSIVERGEDSVPYIYEQLKAGSTHLIYALELIYPNRVTYNKQVITLKRARKIWLKILKEQFAK